MPVDLCPRRHQEEVQGRAGQDEELPQQTDESGGVCPRDAADESQAAAAGPAAGLDKGDAGAAGRAHCSEGLREGSGAGGLSTFHCTNTCYYYYYCVILRWREPSLT